METARPFLVAPSAVVPVERQFVELFAWAGQVWVAGALERAAALGLGLAAKTLATPHALSAPAMTIAATAALTRDAWRVGP
jgi:hypothetical protein